ncbi:hypothetical protein N9L33_01885 [Nitrospinae bacterium]|nr:hypothetical protein [Nitrospinota bacterium]
MGKNYDELASEYRDKGFVIIDDFLPEEVANNLESLYLKKDNDWIFHDQVRDQKYGNGKHGLFKTEAPYFPGEGEAYSAKFWWSEKLGAEIKGVFDDYFKPALKEISQLQLTEYDVRCYKLDKGCHYRVHFDYWAANIGCIYYVNKKWIWDWGGILHVGLGDSVDSVTPIFPKFNRAIFVDHGGFRIPHFISHVADYAQGSRLSLISLNK